MKEDERFDSDEEIEFSEDRWKKRRTVIYITLTFCAISIVYLMAFGKDNELHNTIANGLIFLASSVIITYVGGSAYEDTRMQLGTRRPRQKKDPFR